MSQLFQPYTLRGVTFRNRVTVAPMCQYSSVHGLANDWHLVHLGRFALGGFGLVTLEATAVSPEGRISYADLGLWEDAQIEPLARVVGFLKSQGAAAGIQLAHAGRKAATPVMWRGGFNETEAEKPVVGFETWQPVAPSAVRHSDAPVFQTPAELSVDDIRRLVGDFAAAAQRAEKAGFDVVELHGAHGYLINEFLSPIANRRTDDYGGSRENRMRFALEVTEAVRAVWPDEKPLFVRLSVSDAAEGGWTVEDSQVLAGELKARGVDLVHCSSGGVSSYSMQPAPSYQVPLAAAVRETGIPTMAVGLITEPAQAEAVIAGGEADMVALARGALDDPNWPLHARRALDPAAPYDLWPKQARDRVRDKDRVLATAAGA